MQILLLHLSAFLYSLIFFPVNIVYGEIEWKTVLLATKESGKNIKPDLFERWGESINNDTPTTEDDSVFDIAKRTTFRSPLVDRWASENHTHVRVGLFNKQGDLLWWITFNGFLSDLTNWNRPTRIQMASHETLTQNTLDIKINFDDYSINVTTGDKGWLWIYKKDAITRMLFSKNVAKPFPGIDYVQKSNTEVVQSTINSPTNTFSFSLRNSWFWIGLNAPTYLVGFGIEKEAEGSVTAFKLSYTANETCFSHLKDNEWVYYKDKNGKPSVIKPTYDANGRYYIDNSSMVTVLGKCLGIQIVSITGSSSASAKILLFHAYGDILEADIFAIQWGLDPQMDNPLQHAVDKIHSDLRYDKYNTTKYRSQFTSAKDTRPSAVLFGVFGLIVFLLVVASIILLDIATLRRQVKYAKRNTEAFRMKVREKWKLLKSSVLSTFGKLRGSGAVTGSGKSTTKAASVSQQPGPSKIKVISKSANPKPGTSAPAVNVKHGSGVSVVNLSAKSKYSTNKSGRKKTPAVLTQISE